MKKGYTDINQAIKLSKVLPSGSEDMYWNCVGSLKEPLVFCDHPSFEIVTQMDIPCWSLTALLEHIPPRVQNIRSWDGDSGSIHWLWDPTYYFATKQYDNLVDACVEFILNGQ